MPKNFTIIDTSQLIIGALKEVIKLLGVWFISGLTMGQTL
jgi:hypothetical protein